MVKCEEDSAKNRLESLAAAFAADGRRVTFRVSTDETVFGLLAVAAEPSADLIVLGAQGLTGMDRFLLGSVSEKVLRHAPCSVLVVRPCLSKGEALPPIQGSDGATGPG